MQCIRDTLKNIRIDYHTSSLIYTGKEILKGDKIPELFGRIIPYFAPSGV
jgi:hypothetical protein